MLEDPPRRAGQRHTLPLCLALFIKGYSVSESSSVSAAALRRIAAGNKGFLAIGDVDGTGSKNKYEVFVSLTHFQGVFAFF
ncbi:MAG: hypothetical protein DSM106950_40095 [Stigonema ocellatum SAG 48.90 = DSM 106950]|nr:hypothetical protein [Stigonema ocellatum SAG 48.90 = DSM 106950]